jgi:flagellar hook-associated protein 1 FlgK
MSNLLAALTSSGNALDVFQQALGVIQNNVNNSSTPGYATQTLNLEALPLVVTGGLTGGVAAHGLQDSRDDYAEEQVQLQTQTLGKYTAQANATGAIESFFDVSGTGGLPAALNNLLSAFSAWSATPNDATAQQTVLSSAQSLASSVNGLANSLSSTSQQLDTQIGSTVSQINTIAAQIQQYNEQVVQQTQPDPGTEAQLYSSLDNLSQLTNFTTVTQTDGTVTVMLGGGTPLVIGDQVNALQVVDSVDTNPPAANPSSPPTAHIVDSAGADITSQVDSGQLGGLLDVRNRVLGSLLGDSQQAGSLNQFAKTLADTVNQILESGTVSSSAGAASGVALFTYDSSDATHAAASLALNPAITGSQLAQVDSSGTANGIANQLADLGNAGNTAGNIDGMNLVEFLGQIASSVGQENQTATANQTTQQQVASQATTLRDQVSGVNLDEQATSVLQFQRAYQATAQVLTVLNDVLDTTMNMMTVTT